MAQSPVREIEVKQTPTEAWTKRFRVTTKNPLEPLPPLPSDHILRFNAEPDWPLEQILEKAQGFAGNWFQQALLAALSSYIKDQIAEGEPLGFTSVTAAKVSEEQVSTSSWAVKKELHSGTGYIYQDVDAAITALGKSTVLDPSNMRTRNMSLLYPYGYDGQIYSVKQQLEQNYPRLQLLSKDNLVASNTPFALLLCNDEAAAKIGTFELHDKIKLFRDDENPDFTTYILAFPSYSLDILAPEQIVVLTGI